MPEETCPNCGVPISEAPEDDGMHPVQMATAIEGGEMYCEACAFHGGDPDEDGYHATGDDIVRAAGVDMSDEELASLLAETMKVEPLRRWMSANDMQRSRGARKHESARQAVEQNRDLVAGSLDRVHGISDTERFSVHCQCGHEEHFMNEEDAVAAAERHKSENPQHFPKAWSGDGRRLYG